MARWAARPRADSATAQRSAVMLRAALWQAPAGRRSTWQAAAPRAQAAEALPAARMATSTQRA